MEPYIAVSLVVARDDEHRQSSIQRPTSRTGRGVLKAAIGNFCGPRTVKDCLPEVASTGVQIAAIRVDALTHAKPANFCHIDRA